MVNFTFALTFTTIFKCRVIAQTVSRRPLTTEVRIRSQDSCEICGGKIGTGKGFPSSISVASIPPILHKHLHLNISLTWRTNGGRTAIFSKSNALSENRGALGRKLLSLFLVLRVEKRQVQIVVYKSTTRTCNSPCTGSSLLLRIDLYSEINPENIISVLISRWRHY